MEFGYGVSRLATGLYLGLQRFSRGLLTALQRFSRGLVSFSRLTLRVLNSYYQTLKNVALDIASHLGQLIFVLVKILLFFLPGIVSMGWGILGPPTSYSLLLVGGGTVYVVILAIMGLVFSGTDMHEIDSLPRKWLLFFPTRWASTPQIRDELIVLIESYDNADSEIASTLAILGRTNPLFGTVAQLRTRCKRKMFKMRSFVGQFLRWQRSKEATDTVDRISEETRKLIESFRSITDLMVSLKGALTTMETATVGEKKLLMDEDDLSEGATDIDRYIQALKELS